MTKRNNDNKRRVNQRRTSTRRTTTRSSSSTRRRRKKKVKIKKGRVAIAALGLVLVVVVGGFLIKTVFNAGAKIWPNVVYLKETFIGGNDSENVDNKEQFDLQDENQATIEKQKVIFIDIARGGNDKGYTTESGVSEKEINLKVGEAIAKKLSKYGDVTAIMSRQDDVNLTLDERKEAALAANAEMFVSINLTSENTKSAQGVETIYNPNSSPSSADFAKVMQTSVAAHINTKNRGVNPYDIYILKGSEIPSVTVQYGFLSNEAEAKKLVTKKYQDQVAEGIVQGILAYIDAQK